MNTEKLILKGAETKLIGGRTLFKVESLNEHFDGLVIHESDWVQVEDEAYVVLSDVNFDNATDNEIQRKSEVAEEKPTAGITFEEAEILMGLGELIALPEWGGFWFKNLNVENLEERETLVFTKEGEITNTPFEEFKERNDWITVDATPEQQEILDEYFAYIEVPTNEIDIVVTQETLDMNPKLVAEGIEVGETITIDAAEDFPVWVNPEIEVVDKEELKAIETIPTEKSEEPNVEVILDKLSIVTGNEIILKDGVQIHPKAPKKKK